MKIEVDLNKKYLIFFGIIVVFALMGGVLAVVGHSYTEINWGTGNYFSLGTGAQWIYVPNAAVQNNLLVGNGTNGIGIGRGANIPRYALDVNGSIFATGTICSGSICLTSSGTTITGTSPWTSAGYNAISFDGDVGIGYMNPEDLTPWGDLSVDGKVLAEEGVTTSIIRVKPELHEDYMNVNSNAILVDVNGSVSAKKYCIDGANCISSWPPGSTTTTTTTTTNPVSTTPGWISQGVVNVPGTDSVKAKEFTVNFKGWVIINSTLKVDVSGASVTAYSRVCKNLDTTPIAIAAPIYLTANCGPEHSTTSTDYQYYKDAIAVNPGDKIQLYLRSSHAGVYTASTNLLKTETIYSTPGLVLGGGAGFNNPHSWSGNSCTSWGEAYCSGLTLICPASVSTLRVTGSTASTSGATTTTTTYYLCIEN